MTGPARLKAGNKPENPRRLSATDQRIEKATVKAAQYVAILEYCTFDLRINIIPNRLCLDRRI